MLNNLNTDAQMKLAKANLALTARLYELGHQQNMLLIEGLQKTLSEAFAEFQAAAKTALGAGDWAAFSTAWTTMPLLMLKMQTRQMQQILEFNAKTQQNMNMVLRDAMSSWQKDAGAALQETAGSMPVSTALRNWFDGASLLQPHDDLSAHGSVIARPGEYGRVAP